MANKKAPAGGTADGAAAAQSAQQVCVPTVGQALRFLLPVLTPHRPGSGIFTALVGIASDGGAARG